MKEIKVYSTPSCPWCLILKNFLNKKGIKYEDVDISSDHEAAREMIEKSGEIGVPQIEIDGRIIVGFDQEAVLNALEE